MNPDEIDELLKSSVERLKNIYGFEKVRFIILYGSAVKGMTRENSDIDLCIDIEAESDYERSKFRLSVLSELPDYFDVQIFAQLPLYVKKEVLKGKVIFCRDEEYLYEIAISTIKEFEDFKYRFYDYIGERALA
ncbi:MAG: nucleotidyltransferase domain-containing protein [Candidatus Methanoperedens sp.]|nr:nucleotidyltransferase domain-containing protein [Candidatus Methanoperedens sp.]MCZ7368950.1 nucleotidyltransferase domain-containing protein [Candidatus Methanoperedens sp.]